MTWWRALRLIIALAFVALLLWKAQPWRLGEVWTRLDLLPVLFVLLLNLPTPLVIALRSRLVIGRLGYNVPFSSLLPIAFFGFMAGVITPARSGEILRAIMLKERHGIPMPHGISCVMYERLYSFYLMSLSTLAFAVVILWVPHLTIVPALVACFVALALAPTILYARLRRLFHAMPLLRLPRRLASSLLSAGFRDRWQEGESALALLFADAALAARFSVITLLFFTTSALQLWVIASALDLSLSFSAAWLAWGGFAVVGVLSFLPAGLGPADAALVFLLDRQAIAVGSATVLAIILRLLVQLPSGLMAIAAFVYATRRTPGLAVSVSNGDVGDLASSQATSPSTQQSC